MGHIILRMLPYMVWVYSIGIWALSIVGMVKYISCCQSSTQEDKSSNAPLHCFVVAIKPIL